MARRAGSQADGSLSAQDYLSWAEEVNRIEREYPDEQFGNLANRPGERATAPLRQAMACCFRDNMLHVLDCRQGQRHTAQPLPDPHRPLQPGETIYDRADQPDPSSLPDITIHHLAGLPQRSRIQRQHAGPNIALQERIRIQDTDDYPTIEAHLAQQTPLHWAYQDGYASPTLVPYQGRYFR